MNHNIRNEIKSIIVREGLTMDEVRAVMQDMVTKQAILSGNNPVSGIKDAYLYESSRQELA